ncbi:MAG: MotA/TolQ/ExbB proton channel family protein [Solirubrobacterales bacterium]
MIIPYAASFGDTITDAVAEIAEGLFYPVLIAAMVALLLVAWEIGRVAWEALRRSQTPKTPFDQVARHAQAQAASGDTAGAQATLSTYAYNDRMKRATIGTLFATNPIDAQRAVIDYDLYVSKRLDRVRLLVRAGPALGLMGTLIPLAPALAALGKGQPSVLADELQTAFAITVVGVLLGLLAFGVALLRERYFTRDLVDLEYLREIRGDAAIPMAASALQPSAAAPAQSSQADQPTAVAAVAAGDKAKAPAAAPTAAASTPTPAPSVSPSPTSPTPTPTAPAPAAPAQAPAAAPPPPGQPKKRFGIRKKTPKAPTGPPPAFPPPPPAPAAPAAGAPPAPPTDKSPSIPDAPNDDSTGSADKPSGGNDS